MRRYAVRRNDTGCATPPSSSACCSAESAETATQARTHGAAATRNDKPATVIELLEQLKGYIQKTADANKENGAAIIQSAGVSVRKAVVRAPRTFEAKAGAVSGTVKLVCRIRGPPGVVRVQHSTDGGKTWLLAPVTLQAKTTILGRGTGANSSRSS